MNNRSQKSKLVAGTRNRTRRQHAKIVEAIEPRCLLSAVPTPAHVVVVVEENHSYDEVIGNTDAPYINSLATQGVSFTNSHANTHPSQPNYLALFSGSTQGVTDDNATPTFNKANLGSELIGAGLTFAGYSEDLPKVGSTALTSGSYARKHNPWSDFSNVPSSANQPFTAFPTDFNQLPTVSFVVPNIDNDMHDGSVATGDQWLQSNLGAYATWAKTHNSVLIVTWDEDDSSQSNQIPTIFYGANVKTGQYSESITHYNVLRTLEDMYSLPTAGASASAATISDVWQTTATVPPPVTMVDSIAGSAGADTVTLTQDADHQHIDWSMGTTTGQMLINDAKGLTITGNGGSDKITLNYANGNPLPNLVSLNGSFTINGLQGSTPLAGIKLNLNSSTVYVMYASPASDPIKSIQSALKTGYNNGKWDGASSPTTGAIVSANAATSPTMMSIAYSDSSDGTGNNIVANSIRLQYARIGDSSFNGTVSVSALFSNYNKTSGASWAMGDYNYDGSVNITDANLAVPSYTAFVKSQPSAQTGGGTGSTTGSGSGTTTGTGGGTGTGSSTGTSSGTGTTTGTGSSGGTGTSTGTGSSSGTGSGNSSGTGTSGTGTGSGTSTGTSTGSSSGSIIPASTSVPSNITWSAPIVITKGGTYTGNWFSNDPNTAAVTIATSQPVIIINSNIQSRGNLIETSTSHANVTIKNTHGWALNPNVRGKSPGRFLDAENFDNLDIENNTMVGTAGIEMGYYAGNGTTSNTVTILRNNALNIDGRWSDGAGGYQTNAAANDYVQFAQFNACHNMPGVEIAWNQVINQPGQSRPEDNISVFQSSGTAASPMLIHDNYIQGAYPADPVNDGSFTGGGIMVSDGNTNSASTDTGHVRAYNNVVVGTTNYGIAVSSGLDNQVYNNIVISSGLLPGGQKPASQNVGIYVWNQSGDPFFQAPKVFGNTVGWNGKSGRNDEWTPDASGVTDTSLSGSITSATEAQYYNVWAQRVTAAGQVVGA